MGKSSERRFKKEAKRLTELVEKDTSSFLKVWNCRIDRWLWEMCDIARQIQIKENTKETNQTASDKKLSKKKMEVQTISGIWKRADNLIRACGEKVEALIGSQTRNLLDAECARLIAQVYDPQLYRIIAYRQYTEKGKTKNRVLSRSKRI